MLMLPPPASIRMLLTWQPNDTPSGVKITLSRSYHLACPCLSNALLGLLSQNQKTQSTLGISRLNSVPFWKKINREPMFVCDLSLVSCDDRNSAQNTALLLKQCWFCCLICDKSSFLFFFGCADGCFEALFWLGFPFWTCSSWKKGFTI